MKNISEKIVRCPLCGNNMIVRIAKKGINAGNKFWGCIQYPDCRGIVPCEEVEPSNIAKIGSIVKIKLISTNEVVEYRIIQLYRKNIAHTGVPFGIQTKTMEVITNLKKDGELSVESPLGKELIGKCIGQTIEYNSLEGKQKVLVMGIS